MARLFIRTPAFIKQSFTDLKNPAFRKILVFFIIAMIIPVTGVTYFSIRHSTENIVAQVRQSSINSLSDKKNILELRFAEFDKLCYQIFNNNDLNRSRRTPVLSFSHMDHLKNFLEYLSGLRFTNDLIDSIYVYDIGNNYILSGAKFSPEAFEDIEIIKLGMEREFGIVHRKLNGLDVISYIRNLSHVSYSHNLIIVINVNYNNLFNITQDRKNNLDTLIFDDSGSIVMLDSEILQTVPSGTINSIMSSSEESGIYYINETEYFICNMRCDDIGWNIAYLQPYSGIVLQAALTKKLILSSFLLILLLSFILACIYSFFLYRPIGYLATKVKEQLPAGAAKFDDAYKSIDRAVTALFNENRSLAQKYKRVLPYFKQFSISNLLSDGIFDINKFTDILNLLGIQFIYRQYVNVIIDFENTWFSEKVRNYFETALSRYTKDMSFIVLSVNSYRSSVVINTNLNEMDVYKIIEDVKLELNSRSIEMTMAIGKPYGDINDTYPQHQKNLSLMDNKFFLGKGKVIISTDNYKPSKKCIYNKSLEEKLISCISNQDSDGAAQVLSLLNEGFIKNNASAINIRFVYYQIIHNIIEYLDGIGVDSGEISASNVEIFDSIMNSGTLNELEEYTGAIISMCINLVNKYREMQHNIIADKAIEYIKANCHKDIGVDEVARIVYLSPGHLNIIFKLVTGWPVYEYITKLRMEAAIKLLKENNRKVKDIASEVGYNNVQCFLRLFKKYYNMTPVEYRRSL